MPRARVRILSALGGCGLCIASIACAGEATEGGGSTPGSVTANGKQFGVLTWTDHADDWRGRLVGEHLTPLRGPGALRPLGRMVAPGLRTDALPGVTLEGDPRRSQFMLRYRLTF